jgi:hypothetical protein
MTTELLPVGLTGIQLRARSRLEQLRAEARDERMARLARGTHPDDSRPIDGLAVLTNLLGRRTVQ